MCRLFETIWIENGQPLHLPWHEARIASARQELWGIAEGFGLDRILKVPSEYTNGTLRCKVIYEKDLIEITFRPHVKRPVRSLKLMYAASFDYHLKYYDRKAIEALFDLRGDCDDIIIVKGGLITDTSISNLIFFDGKHWYTPAKPLLEGTCRAWLLSEGTIMARDIRPEDLDQYLGCKLINAMREPEEEEMIPIAAILR
ncbi:MAG: aminotransferase class IV family protein [Bacteroidetes bacterium]|nr:aminotransferase class IV family protein [Bacteroidota bacterium]